MVRDPEHRQLGIPRKTKDYRFWRRNNAISWKGVESVKQEEHPPLVKKISKKGEVHYVELWE